MKFPGIDPVPPYEPADDEVAAAVAALIASDVTSRANPAAIARVAVQAAGAARANRPFVIDAWMLGEPPAGRRSTTPPPKPRRRSGKPIAPVTGTKV